jgi:hypothetical protein
MPNYKEGKVYSIRSPHTDKVYIGSTVASLSKRFSQHKRTTHNCSSKQIIDAGDAYIELIEASPCNSKEELFRREAQIIRQTTNCINISSPKTIERINDMYRAYIIHVEDDFFLLVSEKDRKTHKIARTKEAPIPTGKITINNEELTLGDTVFNGSRLFSACREYMYDANRKREVYHKKKAEHTTEENVAEFDFTTAWY